ncbi:hypothetical protein AYO21_00184 [Fonsecaea monophora]|uniref:Kinetochore protein fta7 n=1 Tax=Fonsecaea monophora TaxID=254056 RepID=A0A177FMS9_9EURO|nr:hypothetical protein AYO21_00184 [Fonsecaea monophora]KAH0842191.1 hypothetical protein FOPE_07543 [Fonsecaea pedrosoi]OAG45548.1 hypothetical protein AYO21_00184 [Fonsecaea monophora]
MVAAKPPQSRSGSLSLSGGPATLEPRIKQVSQTTIRKKWRPLPPSSQEKVRQLFLNVKTRRSGAGGNGRIPPVGKIRNNDNNNNAKMPKRNATTASVREDEYEKAVEEVAEKLLTRLPRMPFPQTNSSTVDDSPFDLSATLARVATLQSQLTTNLQSAQLLRRQINREKLALKRDRAQLKALEEGFKGSEALRRKKDRGLHPIAKNLHRSEDEDAGGREAELREEVERVNNIAGILPVDQRTSAMSKPKTRSPPTLSPGSDDDPELNSLLNQLRSHLLSMQNNTASMLPVLAAMDETKVTLDKFAARHGIGNSLANT